MALHRNVTSAPLDMPDGRQLFVGADADLTPADLETDEVTAYLEQRALVPVTMTTTAAPAGKVAS